MSGSCGGGAFLKPFLSRWEPLQALDLGCNIQGAPFRLTRRLPELVDVVEEQPYELGDLSIACRLSALPIIHAKNGLYGDSLNLLALGNKIGVVDRC